MERRILGRTGISVSTLGVGTGQFGRFGQTSEADCIRIAHAAFDGGVNLIDTADFYSFGEAETIAGKAIADRRDRVVVATKCGMPMSNDPNESGGSRRWINLSINRSLKRLGVDYVDLYQLHQPDPATPIEETIDAMTDLVRAGKIRSFGLSNSTAVHVTEAALRAQMRGFSLPQSEQSAYSIFARGPEAELLPETQRFGLGFLAYSPLDGGWLSGKYRTGSNVAPSARHRLQPGKFDLSSPVNQSKLDAVEALAEVAAEAGLGLSHMAIAFVLSHPAVTSALVGGGRLEHIEAHLAGQDARLSEEILDRIDAIVAPGVNMPEAPQRSPALQDASLRRRRSKPAEARASGVDFIRNLVMTEPRT
jgi:aryl-alcohol dehydrogenase-like predicted oxidoreductase